MRQISLQLVETLKSVRHYKIEVPDDWTDEMVRKEINPYTLDMYQECLPEAVKIVYSDADWEHEDLDIMGRGDLEIGRVEEISGAKQ